MCRRADRPNLSVPSDEQDHRVTTRPEKNQTAKDRRRCESLCVDPMRDSLRSLTKTDSRFRDRSARRQFRVPRRLEFLDVSYSKRITESSSQSLSSDLQNVDRN